MDFVHVFNSTILVLWVVMFVPAMYKEGKMYAIFISGLLLYVAELLLIRGTFEFPRNVLAPTAIMLNAAFFSYLYIKLSKPKDKK